MTKFRIKKYYNPNTEYTWYVVQKRLAWIFWATETRSGWELDPFIYKHYEILEEAVNTIKDLCQPKVKAKKIESEVTLSYDKNGVPI